MKVDHTLASSLKIAVLLILSFAPQLNASERAAQKAFDRVQNDPVGLRGFLQHFPKGGDLHNHIDGAVYAENMINWAAEDGRCIDL
jgi:adenosine deaminase